MSSLQQNASFLTFSGELTSSGAVRLLSVLLQAPGHRLTLEANGGGDWLREDLAELGEELLRAAQRRPVRRDWFLYDLPGLRLEDFQPDVEFQDPSAGHPAPHARRRSAVGGQAERGGRSASFGRCCFAIAQPFGLSPCDGG